jgi:hypothetical protein
MMDVMASPAPRPICTTPPPSAAPLPTEISAYAKTGNSTPPPVVPVVVVAPKEEFSDVTNKTVQRLARPRALSLSFGSFGTEEDLLMQIQSHTMDPPLEASQMKALEKREAPRPRASSLSMLFSNDETFLEDCQDAFNVDITLDAFAEVDNLLAQDYDSNGLFGNSHLENPVNIKTEGKSRRRGMSGEYQEGRKRQRFPNPKFGDISYNGKKNPDPMEFDALMECEEDIRSRRKGSIGNGMTRGTTRPKVKYCRLCIEPGCTKNAQGATRKCIAHGGGRRCIVDNCTKSAQGTTRKCKAHGGGRRCSFPNCTKSARGSTNKCKAHGGGRRCEADGCNNSAAGSTFRCITHGGGRKCIVENCTKSAAGSTPKCKAHGGGRRCVIEGCTKSAQGATYKCIAHGGGRRCSVAGCPKSAQGATDKCKAHGGGKRCNHDHCNKTVYRATDKCKAHGEALKSFFKTE